MVKSRDDVGFRSWLAKEIHSEPGIPYKPALEPGFVFAFAKPDAVRSYKRDYNRWRKAHTAQLANIHLGFENMEYGEGRKICSQCGKRLV